MKKAYKGIHIGNDAIERIVMEAFGLYACTNAEILARITKEERKRIIEAVCCMAEDERTDRNDICEFAYNEIGWICLSACNMKHPAIVNL